MSIRLRTAKNADCLRLWRWRNEPAVRKVSFQTRVIPLAEHKAWFARKIKDADTRILIGVSKTPFGFARIDKLKKTEGEIHIAVRKKDWGKGLGEQLLEKACRYGFKKMRLKTILAQIKPENRRSVKLFEKAGFKPASKKAAALAYRRRNPYV